MVGSSFDWRNIVTFETAINGKETKLKKSLIIAVAGAGTMGVTLARLFAQYGYETILWNRRSSSLERGEAEIRKELEALKAGNIIAEEPEKIIGRLTFTTDWNDFARADYVIENVAEDMDVKAEFYKKLCTFVSDDTIIASNTSGLKIGDIAASVSKPQRFCGMHFWNPPDLLPLVEVTRGAETAEETSDKIFELALLLDKEPIRVKKDILGIIGNRLQLSVVREALYLLSLDIASPEDIDKAMKYGPGLRYPILGPLESLDFTGLDVADAISTYLYPDFCSDMRSQVLTDKIEEGKLGVKTGAGLFDYPDDAGAKKLRWRNDMLLQLRTLLKGKEFKNV